MGETIEGMDVVIAATPLARLAGVASAPRGCAVMIVPCRDIHTVGMREPIDVAFVDGEGIVVASHRGVGPARRLRNGRAVAVVERRSSDGGAWFGCGDRVVLGSGAAHGERIDRQQGGSV